VGFGADAEYVMVREGRVAVSLAKLASDDGKRLALPSRLMTVQAILRVIDEPTDERDIPRLVDEAKAGTPGAFDRLAVSVERRVRGWAGRIAADPDEAEDVTQDVLIKLQRILHKFAGSSRFSTWLYQVTRNTALERRRREARHSGPRIDAIELHEAALVAPAVVDLVDETLLARAILEHFDALPARQRQIFELADLQGRSPIEIAGMLDMKPVTVRASLFKARRTIRTRMLEQHPDLLKEYLS
jgi:RNA polymerase sigma-70 factor, ECF subfamily